MSKSFLHGLIVSCLFTGVLFANEGNAQRKSINEVLTSPEISQVSVGEVMTNTGYWEVKEVEPTGNIASVISSVMERQPVWILMN